MKTGPSLDRLSIKGFKSIRALKDLKLTNLNIIIGGNGAGKSNLISFFKMLRALMDGKLNRYVRDNGGGGDLLFNGRKVTKKMEFETQFGAYGFRFKLVATPNNGCAIEDEVRYYAHGSTGWWLLGDSDDGRSKIVSEVKKQHTSDAKFSQPIYEAISAWQIYHFHDTSATAAMRNYEIVEDNIMLRMDEGDKVKLSWNQKGSDYPMQPYHFSDGSIRFICLATALLQPNPPSMIVINEPELGLHPEAIAVLGELLEDASTRTQVIVATQSPTLIDHFSIDDIITVNRMGGQSTFQRLKEDDFNVWLENYSVGELWTKNVISGGSNYE